MQNSAKKALVFSVAAACFTTFAVADEQASEVKLDKVTVTATKTPVKVNEVPVSVDVLTSEDIAAKAGASDVYEAVRGVPGVQINSDKSAMSEIFIRGEIPAVLLGGRDSRQFASYYAFDPGLVDLEAVERIEVLKGPQSTMYGGRAVSGAINFIMKKGDKDHPFLSLRSVVGSDKYLQGGLTTGGGVDKFSYIFSISGERQDKFTTPKGTIPFNKSKQKNFYTRLDYDVADGHTLIFDATYNKNRNVAGGYGQPYEGLDPFDKIIFDVNPSVLKSAYLSYDGKFNDLFSLYTSFGGGEHNYRYFYGDNSDPSEYLNRLNYEDRKNKFLYGELRGTLNLLDERLKILTGVQSKSTKLDWFLTDTYSGGKNVQEKETYVAPYAQIEYRPIDQILAVAGVRYDSYKYDKSSSKSAVSPRFSISYFPFAGTEFDYTTLWGSYTQSFNPPNAMQLLGVGYNLVPNFSLEPEKAKSLEFGIKQRFGYWANLELSYFDTDYKNMIIVDTYSGRLKQFKNLSKVSIKGIETKLEIYPTEWLTLYFGYTGFVKKDKLTGERLPGQTSNQADKILQYGVSIDDLNGFYANLLGVTMKDYRNTKGVAKRIGTFYPSNNKTIWNLKLSYKFTTKNDMTIEPFFAVNNLSNQIYYEGYAPQMMQKRNYQGGVTFRMNF